MVTEKAVLYGGGCQIGFPQDPPLTQDHAATTVFPCLALWAPDHLRYRELDGEESLHLYPDLSQWY